MKHDQKTKDCASGCWRIAALGGGLLALILWLLVGWSFTQALFIAAVVFIAVGLFLAVFMCKQELDTTPVAGTLGASTDKTIATDSSETVEETSQAAEVEKTLDTVGARVQKIEPSEVVPTLESDVSNTADNAAVPKEEAPKPDTASQEPAKPAKRKPVAADGKPEILTEARESGADDLKQIKGVGPGIEKTLNELGFYHFDQIAGWRKKEIEWVDSRLKFKGRIVRDDWVKQCKVLAKGGTTEFSNKVKKGGVY